MPTSHTPLIEAEVADAQIEYTSLTNAQLAIAEFIDEDIARSLIAVMQLSIPLLFTNINNEGIGDDLANYAETLFFLQKITK